MDYVIEMVNVSKNYGPIEAVKNLSIKLPRGRIYGFLGPNGAGKTTTIKMMLGLTKASEGQIIVNGQKVEAGSEKKLNVGYLPDVPGFYGWMTGKEYLTFCGNLLNLKPQDIEEESQRLLSLSGLKDVSQKIKGYSRGMKQRLGLAQALMGKPSLILLDEPASALDPVGRKEIMDLIQSIKEDITVLFSTHIIADVERVADTVLIMDKGILKAHKDINDIKSEGQSHLISLSFFDSKERIDSFISSLSDIDFVQKIERTANGNIQLAVVDEILAGQKLPKLIQENNLSLKKFEVQSRGLESIFMEVISND